MKPIICRLLLGLTTPMVAASAELHISSIAQQPNGLKVAWTEAADGYAYTLQERDSLTSGGWQEVWTRYRWPSPIMQWTLPEGIDGRGDGRLFRVIAEPIQTPERGKLLAAELVRQFSVSQARSRVSGDDFPSDDVLWPVDYYRIVYETVDPFGLPITASGGLFVPRGVFEPIPLLSYQHGTVIYKPWVPSQDDTFWFSEALLFASSGYVMAMPDYLGLGESPGLHPYLHAKTEATAVVDMLRAVRAFCANEGIGLDSQLFLAGYSQGGHATAAAHREIESYYAEEFTVTASAPMAGPYDMAGSLDFVLTQADYPVPFFFFFAVAAWLPIYDLADTLEELLASPYSQTLPRLLDGNHRVTEVSEAIGPDVQNPLAPAFRDALLNDANHPLRLAAAENNLIDWVPQAPMRLIHCAGDEIVPYENSIMAQQAFADNGACCTALIDPGAPGLLTHDECWRPAMVAAKEWFDTFRQ